MVKPKLFTSLSMSFLILIFPALNVYSQEGVVPSVKVEKAPYVKPGNVTVNFKDADIHAVLRYLSEVGGVDIVPAPDVTGTVTLALTDKPWEVALDIIVKNYGYAYEREGDIIRVVTLSSLKLEELSTEVIPLNYTDAEIAQETISDMLTERGKLTYDSRINALVVTDLATNIYKIKKVMQTLDQKTPQVMIEARIFETDLEDSEKMGIDWDMKITAVGAERPTTIPFTNWGNVPMLGIEELVKYFPFPQTGTTTTQVQQGGTVTATEAAEFPTEPAAGVPFPYVEADSFTFGTLDFTEFKAVLELLKKRSRTEIISNPRITTLNHKEAKITVGQVFNFPIFELSEETSRWIITGYEREDIGINLTVVPHVNAKGEIVVELKPEISQWLGMQEITDELKAPLWATREATTEVMVKDGETIFIGGLINEQVTKTEDKIPLLGDLFGDIPFIGGLVKSEGEGVTKTELIFFITVHIVKDSDSLKKLAVQKHSAIQFPDDIKSESNSNITSENEVIVELPTASRKRPFKKEHTPLFDFRKKK